jgi:hypothetical protein
MRAAIEPTWTTALFRPANRYRDLIRERRGYGSYQLPNGETEVELFPDLSPEHVLATGITWEDFCRFLDNKFVWMGPGVCVCDGFLNDLAGYKVVIDLGPSNSQTPSLYVNAARVPEVQRRRRRLATFWFASWHPLKRMKLT